MPKQTRLRQKHALIDSGKAELPLMNTSTHMSWNDRDNKRLLKPNGVEMLKELLLRAEIVAEMRKNHVKTMRCSRYILFPVFCTKCIIVATFNNTYFICNRYNSQKLGIQQEAGMTPEPEVGTMNRPPLPPRFNSNLNPPPPTIGQAGVTLPHLRRLVPKTIGQPSHKRPKMNPSKLLNNPSPTNNLPQKLTPNQFLQKVLNKQLFFTILMLRIRTSWPLPRTKWYTLPMKNVMRKVGLLLLIRKAKKATSLKITLKWARPHLQRLRPNRVLLRNQLNHGQIPKIITGL